MSISEDTTIVAMTKKSTTPNRSTGSARQALHSRSTQGKTARSLGGGPGCGGGSAGLAVSEWSVLTWAPRQGRHHDGGAAGPTYRHPARGFPGRAASAPERPRGLVGRSFRATDTAGSPAYRRPMDHFA